MSSYSSTQGLIKHLGLAESARLAGQQVPAILSVSFLHECLD